MIKFFRHIRYKLMSENKTGKYFKYAIGEIILVVIGILIALQINNWNEQRQLQNVRKDLIANMLSDFEITHQSIESSMQKTDRLIQDLEKFLSAAVFLSAKVPVDSMMLWAGSAYDLTQFEPAMHSYQTAISTGNISLIKEKRIHELIGQFLLAYKYYEQSVRESGQVFYTGSGLELRKAFGSLHAIGKAKMDTIRGRKDFSKAFQYSEEEFRAKVKNPEVFAAFENFLTLHYNMDEAFSHMHNLTTDILNALNTLDTHQ